MRKYCGLSGSVGMGKKLDFIIFEGFFYFRWVFSGSYTIENLMKFAWLQKYSPEAVINNTHLKKNQLNFN